MWATENRMNETTMRIAPVQRTGAHGAERNIQNRLSRTMPAIGISRKCRCNFMEQECTPKANPEAKARYSVSCMDLKSASRAAQYCFWASSSAWSFFTSNSRRRISWRNFWVSADGAAARGGAGAGGAGRGATDAACGGAKDSADSPRQPEAAAGF